jgi:hypothetical protein
MMPARDNSLLVHRSSLEVLPEEKSWESRGNGRRSENFAYQYLKYLEGALTFRKILRQGTSGLTSDLYLAGLGVKVCSAIVLAFHSGSYASQS